MSADSALKLAAWGVIVAVALQIVFYFVLQLTGRDPFLLSITLTVSVVVGILLLIGWDRLKRAVR